MDADVGHRGSGAEVVIPVHGAAAELERCLVSLARWSPGNRLLLVLDGPQDDRVEELVERSRGALGETDGAVLVERLPVRRGFAAAVNHGLSLCTGDVVVLNSDVEVTDGWLEKLQRAAYSRPLVASVTPFTDNGTLASFPEPFRENLLPAGCSLDDVAAAAARAARDPYVEIPVGVGFCLYLRRAALDAVGLLEERTLGYGEDDDWCLRASRAGFVHLLDHHTFVHHAGGRSFGGAAGALRRRAARRLAWRHPGFRLKVAAAMAADPARAHRRRAVAELTPPRARGAKRLRLVHVVHGWPPFNPAGVESYARWLALDQAGRHEVAVLARTADPERATGTVLSQIDHGVRLRLMVNHFDQRNPLIRNALVSPRAERELGALLDEMRPHLVHVHHLAGHAASLAGVAARRGVPVVYQVQDWWAACARANLVDHRGQPCPGPTPARCSRCLPLTALPPASLLNRVLHVLRARLLQRALGAAAAYVMGSEYIAAWHRERGLLGSGAPVHVLPYGVPQPAPRREMRPPGRPLVFGVIGSLLPHKGAQVAVEAFRGVPEDLAQLRVWGDPAADPVFAARLEAAADGAPVRFCGRFRESEKGQVLGQLDVLLVPSIGLESFGLVAREAMAAGVPVVASRLGALAELPLQGCGAFVPPGDARALRSVVEELAAAPEQIERWRRALPPVRSFAEHAGEVEAVYAEVLGGHA